MGDASVQQDGENGDNYSKFTTLVANSVVCHNTNFDARVKGDQLGLDLLYRWMHCRCLLSRPDIALQWFEKLCRYHSEPQRHYHTLMHLEEMFLYLDLLQDNLQVDPDVEEDAIVLATFFHDAVYNVHSGTNEEDSAVLFRSCVQELRAGGSIMDERLEDSVIQCILATKNHAVSTDHSSTVALFLDLDMAVLGKDAQAYACYAALIRREYGHVPHNVYCQKRADILEQFLTHSVIYGTQAMRMALEQRARDNIVREMESLRRGKFQLVFPTATIKLTTTHRHECLFDQKC